MDYVYPKDLKTECAVLWDVIADSNLISAVRPLITPEMFDTEECRKVWNVIIGMSDNHEEIDSVTIMSRVDANFFFQNIMQTSLPSQLSALGHAQVLRDIYLKRKAYLMANELMELSQGVNVTNEILAMPVKIKDELEKGIVKNTTQNLTEVLNMLGEEFAKGSRDKIATKIPSFDRCSFGGFGKGNLVILAARPSIGKTALMLQFARNIASQGYATLSLSLEMTNVDLGERLVYSTKQVTPREVARRELNWNNFENACKDLERMKMYFDDTAYTLEEVCNTITMNAQQGKCDVAFIDYGGLIDNKTAGGGTIEQVTDLTKRMKKLAKSLGIPIVLLWQLNRGSESENRPPIMRDLRDCGSVEQDADIVLMLERLKDMAGEETIIRMWLRKIRGGIAGDVYLDMYRDETYTNFYELTNEYQNNR